MKTISERLVDRIRSTRCLDQFGIVVPPGATARRTYAGVWQRRAGAWTWSLRQPNGSELFDTNLGYPLTIGSTTPMRVLVAAAEWTVERPYGSDINIDPA